MKNHIEYIDGRTERAFDAEKKASNVKTFKALNSLKNMPSKAIIEAKASKYNISFKYVIYRLIPVIGKTRAIEAARILFGKPIEAGEGFDYQNELIESLPGDIGKLFLTGSRVLEQKATFNHISVKNCANCEHFYIKAGQPRLKTVRDCGKTISMYNDACFIMPSCSCDLSDIDKPLECIQDIYGIFVVPVERTKDHSANKAQIVARQVPCTITQAIDIIEILRVLELDYKSEQELLKSAKRHAKQGKLDHWIERYDFLKAELELVTSSFNMPEDFDATEISLEGIKTITLDYQEPFQVELESYSEADAEDKSELDAITSDFNSLGEFSYYRFDAIHTTPCAGRYATATSKKELFSTAKTEEKTDYKAFYKRLEQLENSINCPELEKAVAFMQSGKINKAKSLARLKAYTYQGQQPPAWLTPDRLNALWKASKSC